MNVLSFARRKASVARPKEPSGLPGMTTWRRSISPRCKQLLSGDDGGPLVEFAMVLPLLVMVMTGIFYLGVGLALYLQLTNATEVGARQVSVARGTTSGSDPCNTAYTSFTAAAPNLSTSYLTFNYTISGTGYTGTSCTGGALTAGSQGTNATVTVSYPVHLGIWGLGWNTITLKASTTEIIQ